MTNSSLFDLTRFNNSDPRVLTVLLIGSEERVQAYIHQQHSLGVIEAGTWSRALPVPNCPSKIMRIFQEVRS